MYKNTIDLLRFILQISSFPRVFVICGTFEVQSSPHSGALRLGLGEVGVFANLRGQQIIFSPSTILNHMQVGLAERQLYTVCITIDNFCAVSLEAKRQI